MRISLYQILARGFRLRCPNCGSKSLFKTWIKPNATCSNCDLKLLRGGGSTLGGMVINYGITVFGLLPFMPLLYSADLISLQTAIIAAVAIALIAPTLLYRLSWSLWLMCYYAFLPHELPANRTEAIPVSDDE